MPALSVVISAHCPDPDRLARTLEGLRAQSLAQDAWELILVDNASNPALRPELLAKLGNGRLVVETKLGLSSARACGFRESTGAVIVMVDDDNVLAPSYLEQVATHFREHPEIGAMGGKSIPEFEVPPPAWLDEFRGLLALRDLGEVPLISEAPSGSSLVYPLFSPIGAGMALRREIAGAWLGGLSTSTLSDRKGGELSSSGDNDIVFRALKDGWRVAYFPDLVLKHLIPAARLSPDYLARLNRGIQKSWIQVLAQHGACPWSRVSPIGARLRIIKAWVRHHAWRGAIERIRFAGDRGHFEGREQI